jgi:hypothetical protein
MVLAVARNMTPALRNDVMTGIEKKMWSLVVANVKSMVEILASFYWEDMGVEPCELKHFNAVVDCGFSGKESWNEILRDYIRILEHVRHCVAERSKCALVRDVVCVLHGLIGIPTGAINEDLFTSENLVTVRSHVSKEVRRRDAWRIVNRDVNVCLQAVSKFCAKHLARIDFQMIEQFEIWCLGVWVECHTNNLKFIEVILLRTKQKFVKGTFDAQINAIDVFYVFLRECVQRPQSVSVDSAWDICLEFQMAFFDI